MICSCIFLPDQQCQLVSIFITYMIDKFGDFFFFSFLFKALQSNALIMEKCWVGLYYDLILHTPKSNCKCNGTRMTTNVYCWICVLNTFPFFSLLQIALMTVTLFPIRLLMAAFMMLLAWPFAFLASVGRSETTVEPQCLWRRWVLCYTYLCLFVCLMEGTFWKPGTTMILSNR